MKIKKYVFRDHYKVSTDRFRDILGLYFDFKDNKLTEESNPRKGILVNSVFEIASPIVVNEDQGIYNQNVLFKPINNQENEAYLNATFKERFIDELNEGLVPRRMNLNSPTAGFDPVIPEEGDTNTNTGADSTPDFIVPFDPVDPPPILTNRDVIYETILGKGKKKYEDINTIVDEVTELKSSTTDSYISTDSKYNFYVPGYENQIQKEIVPEEILPNFYVVSLALNRDILDSISQDDFNSKLAIGSSSPYENLYRKFDRFITLDGNLSLEENSSIGIFFAIALAAYVEQYANIYDSVSLDYIETVKKRFGHIYNNLTNREILDKLNEFKTSYPMFINIEWTTSTLSPLLLFMQNAGISLQALQTFLGDKLVISIKSNPLSRTERFSIVAQSPRLDLNTGEGALSEYVQDLYTYNAGAWISDFLLEIFSGTSDDIVHPNELFVIDQNEKEIPLGDQFGPINETSDIFDILTAIAAVPGYQNLLNTSMRTYSQITDGAVATSEVLLYKIEKRDSQHRLLQTFYIPNVSGINVQNYVDTQVKFNKEYKYKIFAYTVIYGTEYYYDRYSEPDGDVNYYYNTKEGHLHIFSKIALDLPGVNNGGSSPNERRKRKHIPTDITFTCFFRVNSADEGHPLIDVFVNTSVGGEFVLGFFGDSGGLQVDNLLLGKWYNLTIVCRTPKNPNLDIVGTRELYIDGKYAGFVSGDPITKWDGRSFIPGYSGPSDDPIYNPNSGLYYTVDRDIANIAIFTRAFTPEEVKALANTGPCWDLKTFKKGSTAINLPEWSGETPAIYWRTKDINKEVTNDGYAGLANLLFYGDASSLKCTFKGKKRDDGNAEVDPDADDIPNTGVVEPRPFEEEIPPIFDIPIFSDSPPEIFTLPPSDPGDPFKYEDKYGYGEINIPEYKYSATAEVSSTCTKDEQFFPNAEVQENKKRQDTISPLPITAGGETEQPYKRKVSAYRDVTASVYADATATVYSVPEPTVTAISTTVPPSTSIPTPVVTSSPYVRPITAGGETQPPLPAPTKTTFIRKVAPSTTIPENRVSELPPAQTSTKTITPIDKPIIIPKTKKKPLIKGEKL